MVTQKVFKKVQLHVQETLDRARLHGLASDMRAELIEDHLTRNILARFHTFLLGGNPQKVYLEETVEWRSPETWKDHLKQDLAYRARARGRNRLADWLQERVRYTHFSRRVFKTEEVQTHLCPHVAVPTKHGTDLVHFAWLDGQVEESQAMREQLACNGKLH
jgi:hypothetical protein